MKQKTKDIISDGIGNLMTVGLFVAACLFVVWLMLPLKEATTELAEVVEATALTVEDLNYIEKYIHDLETLNEINNELIEVYKLRVLRCEGDLHSS